MNKSMIIVLLSVACLVSVFAVDVTIIGGENFSGIDSTSTQNGLGITAGASLSNVSFTCIGSDSSGIAVYYPGSATRTTIGSIANGATGYGGFQLVAPAGPCALIVVVQYKKSTTWYSFNQTFNFVVSGGDQGTEGKRVVKARDEEFSTLSNGNEDLSIDPIEGWFADDSISIWQGIRVNSKGPALSAVSFTLSPTEGNIAIYYNERTGNVIGNIAANGNGGSSFQMTGPAGDWFCNVRISYRKNGVAKSYTETLSMKIYGGDQGTEGRRAIVNENRKYLPQINVQPKAQQVNNVTIVGLAVGGIALVAIVAVVVVVAVVRRQRTTIVA